MSLIYLIRHAQAGSRDNYDVLSELGHEQARLLGESAGSVDDVYLRTVVSLGSNRTPSLLLTTSLAGSRR